MTNSDRHNSMSSAVINYGGMQLHVELVTPQKAALYLDKNLNNRNLRTRTVDMYARSMDNGAWYEKPVAIAFDEDGNLGNGQHTLRAIIKSGKAQSLLIAHFVPRQAIAHMDTGLKRSISDIAHFVGSDFNNRQANIARIIAYGPKDTVIKSFEEIYEAYDAHRDVIDFVCDLSKGKKKGMGAPVLAVCAKAAYTVPREIITRFFQILRDGMPDGAHESAAVRLRDYLHGTSNLGGASSRADMYGRTMSAMKYFADGRPLAKLYFTERDYFPLPFNDSQEVSHEPTATRSLDRSPRESGHPAGRYAPGNHPAGRPGL